MSELLAPPPQQEHTPQFELDLAPGLPARRGLDSSGGRRRRRRRIRGRLPARARAELYFQLAVIDGSGIPLLDGLGDLARHSRSPLLSAILKEVAERVTDGKRLSEALEAHPRIFPQVEVQVFRAGERREVELVLGERKKQPSH